MFAGIPGNNLTVTFCFSFDIILFVANVIYKTSGLDNNELFILN